MAKKNISKDRIHRGLNNIIDNAITRIPEAKDMITVNINGTGLEIKDHIIHAGIDAKGYIHIFDAHFVTFDATINPDEDDTYTRDRAKVLACVDDDTNNEMQTYEMMLPKAIDQRHALRIANVLERLGLDMGYWESADHVAPVLYHDLRGFADPENSLAAVQEHTRNLGTYDYATYIGWIAPDPDERTGIITDDELKNLMRTTFRDIKHTEDKELINYALKKISALGDAEFEAEVLIEHRLAKSA